MRIPQSVTSIGDRAICGAGELTEIYYGGTKADWDALSKGELWLVTYTSVAIHCSDGDIEGCIFAPE